MAKYERDLKGNFDDFLNYIHQGIIGGSISASFEDGSDWLNGEDKVSVRVYERFSWIGSNRVSLAVTLVGQGDSLFLSAITSGGSQAIFFKINTWGEQSFLEKLQSLAENYNP